MLCRHDKTCVAGFEKRYHGVVSAFMFATETQQTIGKQPPVNLWHHCDDMAHPTLTSQDLQIGVEAQASSLEVLSTDILQAMVGGGRGTAGSVPWLVALDVIYGQRLGRSDAAQHYCAHRKLWDQG